MHLKPAKKPQQTVPRIFFIIYKQTSLFWNCLVPVLSKYLWTLQTIAVLSPPQQSPGPTGQGLKERNKHKCLWQNLLNLIYLHFVFKLFTQDSIKILHIMLHERIICIPSKRLGKFFSCNTAVIILKLIE